MGSVSHFLSLSGVVFLRGLSKTFDRGGQWQLFVPSQDMDTLAARYKVQKEMNLKRTPVTPSNTDCYVFAPVPLPNYWLHRISVSISRWPYLYALQMLSIYMLFKPYLSALQTLSICPSNTIYLPFKWYLYALQMISICFSNPICMLFKCYLSALQMLVQFKCCNLFSFCWNDFFGHLRWLIQ